MDGHDLDRVLGAGLHGRPLLPVARLDQLDELEEGTQRGLALQRGEGVHLLQEGGQVALDGLGARAIDVGFQLVEQAGAADHVGQELGDGRPGLAAQCHQLFPELVQPAPAFRRQPVDLVQVFERLREQVRGGLVLVLVPQLLVAALGPRGHAGQILEPDPVAGPQQDAGQPDPGVGVGDGASVREHLGHLGHPDQPGQPDELCRNPGFPEGELQRLEQAALAAEHREARPGMGRGIGAAQSGGPRCDPRGLGPFVREPDDLDLTLAVRGPRRQPLRRVGPLLDWERLDDLVGRLEDARARPEIRVERQTIGRLAI